MLVLRQGPFNAALDEDDDLPSRHVRAIEIGGLYPLSTRTSLCWNGRGLPAREHRFSNRKFPNGEIL
jgi:hypothetical protein